MDNNLYIDYLNSLHNYNAQNENAYGERNIDNPYFKDVMVRVGLCDYIKENLTVKKPHILILTGHAGDGKTSIMYQVLTDMGAEFDVKEKLSEITLPNGAKCLCVKDFSEIPKEEQTNHIDRINVMKKSVDMVKNGNYVFMVANTGPLINTFGELFDTNDNKEKSRIQLINMMDNNDGEIKFIQDVPLCVINVATVDNVYFATEFLEKIIQDNLWEKCEACNKHHYCHIYRNRNLIVENKTKVYEFINNHFIWLTEYGTRLTIRSMTEQLTYMITGGMSCEEVTNNDAYKYLFSNLFFGYIGTKLNARALNIIAIAAANIPATGYKECGRSSVDELISYLSCKLHPITRIEILAKGVMFQIMRMMSFRVADYLGKETPIWIVDMKAENTDTVKKIAHESFRSLESDFMTAINKMANEAGIADDERMKKVREARINSLDIFKSKGKELQCIIPISGPFERFTLSEDTIRFLVLSLIQPGDKMTLKMFLEKLYQNYRIVIGPEEYRKSMQDSSMDSSLANSFSENVVAFQQFLRSTGFLKELSDATSIVINPYEPIEEVIS